MNKYGGLVSQLAELLPLCKMVAESNPDWGPFWIV